MKNKENKSFVKIHNDTMEPPNNNVVQVTRNRKNPQDMPTGIVDVIQKLESLSTTEEEMPDTLKMTMVTIIYFFDTRSPSKHSKGFFI